MISRLWGLAAGLAIVLALSGCAKARAASIPEGPPLQVPAPPERVLAPVEEPAVAAAPPPESPAPVTPPRPTRPTAEARPTPPAPAPTPAPATTPAAAAAAPPATTPTRDLRAPSTANAPTPTERSVRDLLARAAKDINQVDYSRLSAEGRTQYEQSKRFSIQAEDALRERNLIFASTLADKAATLAAELLGR